MLISKQKAVDAIRIEPEDMVFVQTSTECRHAPGSLSRLRNGSSDNSDKGNLRANPQGGYETDINRILASEIISRKHAAGGIRCDSLDESDKPPP